MRKSTRYFLALLGAAVTAVSLALAGAAPAAHAITFACQVQVFVTPHGVEMPVQRVSPGQVLTLTGSVPARTFTVTTFAQTRTGAFVMTTAPAFPRSWRNTNPFFLTGARCRV